MTAKKPKRKKATAAEREMIRIALHQAIMRVGAARTEVKSAEAQLAFWIQKSEELEREHGE